jgi:hypothetical protein
VIGPIDNTAGTFYIRCPLGHAVDSTCPTPGAAFTGCSRNGVPLTDANFGLLLHAQFDNGGSFDGNYAGWVMQAIKALAVAGYNMSAAISQQTTRFGVIVDANHPGRQLDETLVVP